MADIDKLTIRFTADSRKVHSAISGIVADMNRLKKAVNGLDASKSGKIVKNLKQVSSASANASRQMTVMYSGLTKATNRCARSTKGLAGAFGKFYATYFLAIRGIKKGFEAIGDAMDYSETYNYFNVTMEKIASDASKYGELTAERYMDAYSGTLNDLNAKMTGFSLGTGGELVATGGKSIGLDPAVLMNYQARIGAVTNSVGVLAESTIYAQKAMSMLAADLSSLTNTDINTVMTNLQSLMIGQSRAGYKYGIDTTIASLEELARSEGITKAVSEMTQAEKMQLRIIQMLKSSQVAWGDQANTIGSVANQYRLLRQNMSNLSRVFGSLFIPIIQNALPIINGAVIAIRELLTSLGFNIWGENWLTSINDGITSVGDNGDVIGDIADDMEDAASSAKEFKKQLQGIDELNNLTSSSSGSLGLSVGGLDLSTNIEKYLADYESQWNKAFANMENTSQKMAEKIKKVLEPLFGPLEHLFKGDFGAFGEGLSDLYIDIADGISKGIDKVNWTSIGGKINKFLAGIKWDKVIEATGNVIESILKASFELISALDANSWKIIINLAATALAIKVGGIALDAAMRNMIQGALAKAGFGKATTSVAGGMQAVGAAAVEVGLVVGIVWAGSNFGLELGNALLGTDFTWDDFFKALNAKDAAAAWKAFTNDFNDAMRDTQSEFDFMWGNFKQGWKKTVDDVNDILTTPIFGKEDEIEVVTSGVKSIKNAFTLTINGVEYDLENGGLSQKFEELSGRYFSKFQKAMGKDEEVKKVQATVGEKLKSTLIGAANLAIDGANFIFGKDIFKNIGENVSKGIASGIQSAASMDAISNAITRVGTRIETEFSKVMDIHSPSRVMEDLAQYVPMGVSKGIEDGMQSTYNVVRKYGEGIQTTFSKFGADMPTMEQNGLQQANLASSSMARVASGNTEEMRLMREQNELLREIASKSFGITKDELFSSVRSSANDFYNRTGSPAFL